MEYHARMTLEPGQIFEGRYAIDRLLGRGGFAAVYRARDEHVGRTVALKILDPLPDGAFDREGEGRFLREARVLSQLRDPHTITLYEANRSASGLLYMVFEYVEAEDLHDVVYRQGGLPASVVVHIVRQLAQALREAHAQGILHRDLKPANVLIYRHGDDPWRVKLIDFGIARALHPTPQLEKLTRTGLVVGTPTHMAPEQLCGMDIGPPADIYCLGLLAWEMLMGRRAIDGADRMEIINNQLASWPIRVPGPERFPAPLVTTIERMCIRDPARRLQSAEAVLDALDGGRAAEPPRWAQDSARPRAVGIISSAALKVGLVVAGIACLGFGAVWLGASLQPTAPPQPRDTPRPATISAAFLEEDTIDMRPADDPEPQPTAIVIDTPPPRDGCDVEPEFVGTRRFEIVSFDQKRTFWLRLPDSYDGDERYPLVVAAHSSLHSGEDMLAELASQADENHWIVLAPQSRKVAPAWLAVEEDRRLAELMMEQVDAMLCIDPTRIFAVGNAAGGRFAEQFACDWDVAALAITATRSRLPCERATPTITLVGDRDPYLPRRGGTSCNGKSEVSLASNDRSVRALNRCEEASESWGEFEHGSCREFQGCERAFVSCEIEGGHYWARGKSTVWEWPSCKQVPTEFDYAAAIAAFFAEHRSTRREQAR